MILYQPVRSRFNKHIELPSHVTEVCLRSAWSWQIGHHCQFICKNLWPETKPSLTHAGLTQHRNIRKDTKESQLSVQMPLLVGDHGKRNPDEKTDREAFPVFSWHYDPIYPGACPGTRATSPFVYNLWLEDYKTRGSQEEEFWRTYVILWSLM